MTIASRSKRPWDTLEYQQIVSTSYRGSKVIVVFADGTDVRLTPRRLVSPAGPEPDWSNLRAEEFHLVVPSPTGEIEIPWDIIRVHSDPAYAEHWEEVVAAPVA